MAIISRDFFQPQNRGHRTSSGHRYVAPAAEPFRALIYSQILLSIQLPLTIFLQIYLTSSPKVMGTFRNSRLDNVLLWVIGLVVTALNLALLVDILRPDLLFQAFIK